MSPLNEESISTLVDTFYTYIRADELMGPVFDRVIQDQWPQHLAKMKTFWSSVILGAGTYKGNPMMQHLPIPEMDHEHLNQWLKLWRKTTYDLFEPDVADMFIGKAEMVGERFVFVSSQMRQAQMFESESESSTVAQ